MQLSRRLALFNKYVNNRVQKTWAWLIPPWAIITHHGRTSGREYRTPVLAWRSRGRIVVALHYGAHSDWVRNVVHHQGASIQRLGRTATLVNPRIVDPTTTGEFGSVLRLLVRPAAHALVADLSR